MKKYFFPILSIIIIIIFFFILSCNNSLERKEDNNNRIINTTYTNSGSNSIMVDHTVVDLYDDIPQEYIDMIKTKLLFHTGESHGAQVPYGLQQLGSPYDVSVNDAGIPTENNVLKVNRGLRTIYNSWKGPTNNPQSFFDNVPNTIDYCKDNNITNYIFIHTFCWYNLPRSIEAAEDYCNNMLDLENYLATNHPDANAMIIYFTGNCDDANETYDSQGRWDANQYIRDFCKNNNKVLFDFADLEAYSPTGEQDFYGGVPVIFEGYDEEQVGHVTYECSIRKAKAMWWMLARIAGWDGVPE